MLGIWDGESSALGSDVSAIDGMYEGIYVASFVGIGLGDSLL